jgi:hypothetical protein
MLHAAALVLVLAAVSTLVVLLLRSGGKQAAAGPGDAVNAELAHPQLARSYVTTTGTSIQAVTSYDYRHLDDALGTGLQVTTGAYRQAYRAALTGASAAAAVRAHVVQTFDLLDVGIGAMAKDGGQATLLIFGIEHSASTAGTQSNPVTLTATVRRIGDSFRISRLRQDANAGLPPGTAALRRAAEAGREEIGNLLTFRRAEFAADERRAVAGAASTLRDLVGHRAAATRTALDRGHYDLSGAVTSVAVTSAAGDHVDLLVAATGERIAADGTRTVVTDGRYEVAVARVDGGWLVEQVTPVGTA